MRHVIHEADSRLLHAMCRVSFASFARKCFHTLYPSARFDMNWHIRAVAYQLERIHRGRNKRLIINMPPGTLKSHLISVAWPAFVLGHDPTKRIAVVSYGPELAVSLGNDFRQIVESAWYQQVFPLMRISAKKNTELEVRTTLNGFRLGTTVEGAITGLHADVIIVDDPIKSLDALSDAKRERVNTWFNKSILSRLADPRTGAIVVVMQRQHDNDLSGMLIRTGQWPVLCLPAIAETEEWIPIGNHRDHLRRAGDALHPERETFDELMQRRAEVGPESFAAQWQQQPIPADGTVIKRDHFRYYNELPNGALSSPPFQAWDVASKDGELNDRSVCTTWRHYQKKFYLIDVLRGRFDYPTLRDCAISHAKTYQASVVLIEDAGLGTALVAEMKRAGLSAVGVVPQQSKQIRLQLQLDKFINGDVLFPRAAPFVLDLEAELLAFPRGRFDDQVDSVCLALSHQAPSYDFDRANEGLERFATELWRQKRLIDYLRSNF